MIEGLMAIIAYTMLNVLGPLFAIMRMRKRQSSSDVSIGWIALVLGAIVIIFIYSVSIADAIFMYGAITGIIGMSTILGVIFYYRLRKEKPNGVPTYVDHMTRNKFADYIRAQLEDMERGASGGWYEAKEIADIIAIGIQRIMEIGMDPSEVMLRRIKTRYVDKKTMLKIMQVYDAWWKREFGDK